jgi:pimeloyl-ACP methyl ester carboxylesterase
MFVTAGSAQIFTLSFGNRSHPTILGVGGWTGNWELWAQPFSLLSSTWHTLAYDHRGAGATLAPVETITLDQLIEDVFTVLDAYGIERCVLAAESSGALTAFYAALLHPERILGLVIVDGFTGAGKEPTDEDPFLFGLRNAYRATLSHFVDACLPEADISPIKRWGMQILERATPETAIALYQMAQRADLSARLPEIRQPALLLHGSADAIVPLEQARRMANALPNARLVVLEGAGHVPTMTFPREVAQEIERFAWIP